MRQLERELGTLLRKTATQIASASRQAPIAVDDGGRARSAGAAEGVPGSGHADSVPGVATGLAVTGAGGDVLFVEAASMPGKGLVLTGQLGDVMKESARIALTYVKSHASELGIPSGRARRSRAPRARAGRRHPQGRPERRRDDGHGDCVAAHRPGRQEHDRDDRRGHAARPGAADRRLKQKVLAAHAAGLTEVIVPERNAADLDDVPREVREHMTFHIVGTVDEVLERALEPTALAIAA